MTDEAYDKNSAYMAGVKKVGYFLENEIQTYLLPHKSRTAASCGATVMMMFNEGVSYKM